MLCLPGEERLSSPPDSSSRPLVGALAQQLCHLTIVSCAGVNEVVVAGGMESMSNVPHYLPRARQGIRLGHGQVVDGIIRDGLWDARHDVHMACTASRCRLFLEPASA